VGLVALAIGLLLRRGCVEAAAVGPPQAPAREPVLDRLVGEAERQQLEPADDAVLDPREVPGLSLLRFGCHSPQKATRKVDSPPTRLAAA
jgi:hypothetical protein